MADEKPELNRLDILKALRISNWEGVFSTVHLTLTGGAFQTGVALFLGANNLWMGVLSSFPTFAGLIQIPASYLIEKRGERKWFTALLSGFGRLLWLPILLLPFAAPSALRFPLFVLLLLVSSLLISASAPAFTSWMSDLVPADQRGRYFGRRNMLAGFTTMVVSLPAAWFLDLAVKRNLFPDSVGFAVLFAIAVLCAFVGFRLMTRQPEPPMARGESYPSGVAGMIDFYRAPFQDREFRKFILFAGTMAAAQFFAAPFYVVYALKTLKLDYVWIQVYATLASLSSLLSMPLWGHLADKFGNRPLLAIGVCGTGLLPLLWVISRPEHMVFTFVILILNHLLGGLFWAGVNLSQFNLLIGTTPTERKSVYIGAMSAVTGVMGGLSPIIGGVLLTGLRGVEIHPLGWPMNNYQIVFFINGMLRFIALIPLRRVVTEGATTARDVLSQLGTARVGGWVQMRKLQRAPDEASRRQAMQALRSGRTALAVEELIAALDDPSLHVREEAAETLGDIGDSRAVDALIEHLDDTASGIVDEAAEALGRIGDERAVEPLIRLLSEGEKPDRLAAARALGRIASEKAVAPLVKVIQARESEPSAEVVEAATRALGAIGHPSASVSLLKMLESDQRDFRLVAVRSLGDIGDKSASSPIIALLERENDPAIIAHAAVALALIGESGAVSPLLRSLDKVDSPVARRQVLNAVGSLIGEGESLYPLLALDVYGKEEAVSKMLKEMGRSDGDSRAFGARRVRSVCDRALEQFVAGRLGAAAQLLHRLAVRDQAEGAAVRDVLEWAVNRPDDRPLEVDEFLLALTAARQALQASEISIETEQ
jgi:HEAT repeat protein/MFS family permease